MKRVKIILSLVFFLSVGLLLTNCGSSKKVANPLPSPAPSNTYVQCKTPRPQMCTKEYRPVCAKRDKGIRCIKAPCPSEEEVTYSTACTACADEKVYGYTPGGKCK